METHIKWKTPAEMLELLIREAPEKFSAVLLVQRGDGYFTLSVFGERGGFWEDAPLSNFTCGEFVPASYTRLALIAIQEEK